MQNFFVAASDSVKPLFFNIQNPFTALLKAYSPSGDADHKRLSTTANLQRMARNVESSQPSLAAELRYFASKS